MVDNGANDRLAALTRELLELIGEDLTDMWPSRDRMETRASNGLPSDQDLLHSLWRELGVVPYTAAA